MRIKEARLSKNLRQKELASIIGVAANTLSQYESGKREPDFATFQKIADALMVSTDYLLGRADQKETPAPTDIGLSDSEQTMLQSFRQLNDEGQKRGIEYLGDLLASGRYSSEGE